MNKPIDITIKQKPEQGNEVEDLSSGDIVKFYGGAIGLVCLEYVIILLNGDKTTCFDVFKKEDLNRYEKRLGTLAGITVQED